MPATPLVKSLRALETQLALSSGRRERVEQALTEVRTALSEDPTTADVVTPRLVRLLARRTGPLARPVFDLAITLPGATRGLLEARDPELRVRALTHAREHILNEPELLEILSEHELADHELPPLAAVLPALPRPADAPPGIPHVDALLGWATPSVRRLVARILDLGGPLPEARARSLLGADADALWPWLTWSGARHVDLLDVRPTPGQAPAASDLAHAAHTLGRDTLAEILSDTTWSELRWGLDVHTVTPVHAGGPLPLLLRPPEAELLATAELHHLPPRHVVVTRSGSATPLNPASPELAELLRGYGLVVAETWAQLQSPAPLTAGRTRRILDLIGHLASDYAALFSDGSDEATLLPSVVADLAVRVSSHVEGQPDDALLDPETCGAVREPHASTRLADVRTLAGLFHHLHAASHALTWTRLARVCPLHREIGLRTVDAHGVRTAGGALRVLDFSPIEGRSVALEWALEALLRPLHAGQLDLPELELMAWGDELQLCVRDGDTSSVVRVDLSPPVRGGLLQLHWFGEPDVPPLLTRELLHRLDLDVRGDGTVLSAHYDKERASNLRDLTRRTRALFRALPALARGDRALAGLALSAPAHNRVAAAAADVLLQWGALPDELPAANAAASLDPALLVAVRAELSTRRLSHIPQWDRMPVGLAQLPLERALLRPLREAVRSGEVHADLRGPRACFSREHEAHWLGRLVAAGTDAALRDAALVACCVRAIEPCLELVPTGTVNGLPVERALVPLRNERIGLFVLRDATGAVCLAVAARHGLLYRERCGDTWSPGEELTADELLPHLLRDNYLSAAPPAPDVDVAALRATLGRASPTPRTPWTTAAPARSAAPGCATGFARLGGPPTDDAVLVMRELHPEDVRHLRRAAAIVSTGGGVLSRAGLLALELDKPAVVVSGRWGADGQLFLRRPAHTEETWRIGDVLATGRTDLPDEELAISDGDLLIVDADTGSLEVLGQAPDTLLLFRELQRLQAAATRLGHIDEPTELLEARGQLLRAVHQLSRILGRLTDPALGRLAVHEVMSTTATGTGRIRDLLATLFANPHTADAALDAARTRVAALLRAARRAAEYAEVRLDRAVSPHEIARVQLCVHRVTSSLDRVRSLLTDCDEIEIPTVAPPDLARRVRDRLAAMAHDPVAAHLLGGPAPAAPAPRDDGPTVLWPGDDDLTDHTGSLAGDLVQLEAVVPGAVPAWFAVGRSAHRRVLEQPVGGGRTLAEALRAEPERADLLWAHVDLPHDVVAAVEAARQRLAADFVAVRSSPSDPDEPCYVALGHRGALDEPVRHALAALGTEGGGVIVQRMVQARASGVLHTVSAARPDRMALNAALGLVLGVTSGRVAVDQLTVSRDDREPLRARWRTADKPERIVLAPDGGTTVEAVPWSLRQRPALTLDEVEHVVGAARRLERALHRPLDVEFALEGDHLRILRARLARVYAAALREVVAGEVTL